MEKQKDTSGWGETLAKMSLYANGEKATGRQGMDRK